MATADRSVDTVASLLVTIHQGRSGDFYTSVEKAPPDLGASWSGTDPADSFEWAAESETIATAGRHDARATRWRRWLIAAAAVAALIGGAVALRSPGSSHPVSSTGPTVTTASANASAPSTAVCLDHAGSVCSGPTEVLPGLDAACADLLTTAAHAVGEDSQQWTRSVVVSMVRRGEPLTDVIRQWLTGTRAGVLATRYADPHLETILHDIDSAIAVADTGACSPHG